MHTNPTVGSAASKLHHISIATLKKTQPIVLVKYE